MNINTRLLTINTSWKPILWWKSVRIANSK